jgi:hypothetical protein
MQPDNSGKDRITRIVRDAGGRIVGRTRMQKVAFLLEITGLGEGFRFEYKHYGPYSEELTDAAKMAASFGLLVVSEHQTSWGGWYSTYETREGGTIASVDRAALASEAIKLDSLDLELAATAAYLAFEGYDDPWLETEKRKPEKSADGRLERAKAAYRCLKAIPVPKPLPEIT